MNRSYTTTIWVCVDCMLHHSNAECDDCFGIEDQPNHDRKPWSQLAGDDTVTMGMFTELHDCIPDHDGSAIECDCEIKDFSWDQCSGCASMLGGARYAFTLWWHE